MANKEFLTISSMVSSVLVNMPLIFELYVIPKIPDVTIATISINDKTIEKILLLNPLFTTKGIIEITTRNISAKTIYLTGRYSNSR